MQLKFRLWEPVEVLPLYKLQAGHPFQLKKQLDGSHSPDDVFVKVNYIHDDDKQLIYNLAQQRFKLAASLTDTLPGHFEVERVIVAKPFSLER